MQLIVIVIEIVKSQREKRKQILAWNYPTKQKTESVMRRSKWKVFNR